MTQEKIRGRNKLVPRLLGITRDSIMRVDVNTKEALKTWPLTTVRRWASSPNSFTLVSGGRGREGYIYTNLLPLFSIHTHPPPSPLSSCSFSSLSFFPTLHSYLFFFFFLFFSLRTLVYQNPTTQYRLQRAKLSHNLLLTFFCRRRTPFSVKSRITRTSL